MSAVAPEVSQQVSPPTLPTALPARGGLRLPRVGYGTFQMKDGDCEVAVTEALKAGYTLIDTASIYKNEEAVGRAVTQWEAAHPDRPRVMLESKCSTYEMGFDRATSAFEATLAKLGRDVLDIYVIHWPAVAKKKHSSAEHRLARHQTWRALESLFKGGRVRMIGVSNFTAAHLEQLLEDGVECVPMINQLEVHPLHVPEETIRFCERHHIIIQAYSPLAGGPGSNLARATGGEADGTRLLLTDPLVVSVAESVCRTPAQVVLRWALQHGFAMVPRSQQPLRIRENISLFDFELTPDQMAGLDGLRSTERAQKFCWDPSGVS